ncbi:MAG: plasmid recombination protein [Christensenellales bacterium]
MRGKGSLSHNRREFIAENVDSSRTPLNVEYRNEDIRAVYHELFDDALAHYNEKQTRRDRVIDDYYEKIRTGKQEKLFEELIIQIGNKDDMNASSENGQLARQMLDEYMQSFQQRNPTLRVFSAHLHMDEATPHLHIDFIPFTTGSKRGLETRVSLKKALEALGFTGGTKSHTELNQWIESEKQALASIMARHDIEWEQKGTHEEHLSVLDYKKQERSKEVAALENQIDTLQEQTAVAATTLSEKQEQLDDIAPILKNTEKFVRKYDDPERLLPEAGMLESGKAFREKKALPILGKLLKYARSLFRENTELKAKVQKLEKENTAFKSANWNHTHEMVRLKTENQELHKAKDKLDALVGRIENDVLQKLLRETPKEQPKHKEESL